MTILQFVSVDILVVVLAVFAVIGFFHGARREVTVTLFIILAFILTTWAFGTLVGLINRGYFFMRILLSGALTSDNPGDALARVRGLPPLIANANESTGVQFLVFAIVLWFGYWLSRRGKRVLTPLGIATLRRPPDVLARMAGAVAGAVNGFLILYFILPRFVPGVQAVLVIPTFSTSLLQQKWLFAVILAAIAIFIFVGWERARG